MMTALVLVKVMAMMIVGNGNVLLKLWHLTKSIKYFCMIMRKPLKGTTLNVKFCFRHPKWY